MDPSLQLELMGPVKLARQRYRIDQDDYAGVDKVPLHLKVLVGDLMGWADGDGRSPT